MAAPERSSILTASSIPESLSNELKLKEYESLENRKQQVAGQDFEKGPILSKEDIANNTPYLNGSQTSALDEDTISEAQLENVEVKSGTANEDVDATAPATEHDIAEQTTGEVDGAIELNTRDIEHTSASTVGDSLPEPTEDDTTQHVEEPIAELSQDDSSVRETEPELKENIASEDSAPTEDAETSPAAVEVPLDTSPEPAAALEEPVSTLQQPESVVEEPTTPEPPSTESEAVPEELESAESADTAESQEEHVSTSIADATVEDAEVSPEPVELISEPTPAEPEHEGLPTTSAPESTIETQEAVPTVQDSATVVPADSDLEALNATAGDASEVSKDQVQPDAPTTVVEDAQIDEPKEDIALTEEDNTAATDTLATSGADTSPVEQEQESVAEASQSAIDEQTKDTVNEKDSEPPLEEVEVHEVDAFTKDSEPEEEPRHEEHPEEDGESVATSEVPAASAPPVEEEVVPEPVTEESEPVRETKQEELAQKDEESATTTDVPVEEEIIPELVGKESQIAVDEATSDPSKETVEVGLDRVEHSEPETQSSEIVNEAPVPEVDEDALVETIKVEEEETEIPEPLSVESEAGSQSVEPEVPQQEPTGAHDDHDALTVEGSDEIAVDVEAGSPDGVLEQPSEPTPAEASSPKVAATDFQSEAVDEHEEDVDEGSQNTVNDTLPTHGEHADDSVLTTQPDLEATTNDVIEEEASSAEPNVLPDSAVAETSEQIILAPEDAAPQADLSSVPADVEITEDAAVAPQEAVAQPQELDVLPETAQDADIAATSAQEIEDEPPTDITNAEEPIPHDDGDVEVKQESEPAVLDAPEVQEEQKSDIIEVVEQSPDEETIASDNVSETPDAQVEPEVDNDVPTQVTEESSVLSAPQPTERPSSPWTISYSSSTIGPADQVSEDASEHSVDTNDDTASAEVPEPQPEEVQVVNTPIITVQEEGQESSESLTVDTTEVSHEDETPQETWTPSYSVINQGSSPLLGPTSLEDEITIASAETALSIDSPEAADSKAEDAEDASQEAEQSLVDTVEALSNVVEEPVAPTADDTTIDQPDAIEEAVVEEETTTPVPELVVETVDAADDLQNAEPNKEDRPASPWTPSYSVAVQGSPQISPAEPLADDETQLIHEVSDNVNQENAEQVTTADPVDDTTTESDNQPIDVPPVLQVIINDEIQPSPAEASNDDDAPTEHIERPKSPWTPSYSVAIQGSPASAQKPLEDDHLEAEQSGAVDVSESDAVAAASPVIVETTEPSADDGVVAGDAAVAGWTPSYSVSRQGSPRPSESRVLEEDPSEKPAWAVSYSVSRQGSPLLRHKGLSEEATNTEAKGAPTAEGLSIEIPTVITPAHDKSDVENISDSKSSEQPPRSWSPSYSVTVLQGSTSGIDEFSSNQAIRDLIQPENLKTAQASIDTPQALSMNSTQVFPSTDALDEQGRKNDIAELPSSSGDDKVSTLAPRGRHESTTSSRFFPGGWFSSSAIISEGKASLDEARGEFSPPTSPTQGDEEPKKSRMCIIM